MNRQLITVYLLVAYVHISHQLSTPDSETYIAAVVEYPPTYVANNSELTLRKNSDAYVKHIEKASINNVDIIVFPEDGLTTVSLPEREKMEGWTTIIPSALDNYIPCSQNSINVSETLRKISCAAKENRIYVVINIAEKLPCTGDTCPRDKVFYYNSNVVFDRTGKIIARYRKTNLFTEPQFNVTSVPDITIFDTDFGVKFGTFICFDILFHEPALKLTRLYHITDIVYPTAWFSEVPFLTAVQTQAGWAFGENVNLLAAGYNRPANGNAGSGIYLGRTGTGKEIMPQTVHEEMIIVEVPKIKERTKSNNFRDHSKEHDHTTNPEETKHVHNELRKKREDIVEAKNTIHLLHDNIQAFETFPLNGNITKSICQNNFCCEFKVEITKKDLNTKYRLAVFSGFRRFVVIEAGVRACGIIQCSNNTVSSCNSIEKSETVFNNIEIVATFHDYKNILIMPSTLNSNLLPLKDLTYDDHTHDNHVHISMSLNKSTNNLLTFGIYSRFFSKNDANIASFNIITCFMSLIMALLLSRL